MEGGAEVIIYGELLFAENAIIGGLMLYITGKIHGKSFDSNSSSIKLGLGSILCGIFSFIIFIPIKPYVIFPIEMMFAIFLCSVVFYDRKKIVLWKMAVTFVLTTYFAGGLVMGLLLATDRTGIFTGGGIYTGDMKAGMLAIFITVATMTMKKIITIIEGKKFYEEHNYDVKIKYDSKIIETKGFVDTGNMLSDPVSKRPVIIASEELWGKLTNAESVINASDDEMCRMVLIPYKTIKEKGVLEAIRVDYIYINDGVIKNCLIAKSSRDFKMIDVRRTASCCELLLPASLIQRQ